MVDLVRLVVTAMLAVEPTVIVMNENVTAQLVVTDEDTASPPGYRVRWIGWESGFRDGGLKVGDRIIAIDGKPVTFPADRRERQALVDKSLGHMFEAKGWAEAGKTDGAAASSDIVRSG